MGSLGHLYNILRNPIWEPSIVSHVLDADLLLMIILDTSLSLFSIWHIQPCDTGKRELMLTSYERICYYTWLRISRYVYASQCNPEMDYCDIRKDIHSVASSNIPFYISNLWFGDLKKENWYNYFISLYVNCLYNLLQLNMVA